MDDAAFFGVVVGYAVPFICDFLAASVGGCCDCGFTAATADDLDAAMVDCYGITSDTIFSDLRKANSLQSKVFAFRKCAKG